MTLRKAIIKDLSSNDEIEVMYNPVEYTSSSDLVISKVGTTLQFERLESPTFTVSLFFDTYELGADVRTATGRITALQAPVGPGAKREPPTCLFLWGGFSYEGLVRRVEQRFTMFLPSGVPVRADLTVTFEQVMSAVQAVQNAGLDNCPKLHTVAQGERLDLIAYRELGDASAWLQIAELNDLDDPLNFPKQEQIGMVLAIPDLHRPPAASRAGWAAGLPPSRT
ncbi:hypothetical protein WME79_17190 [Sorangium sp. So ce726]|uniref:CIS tube protein n=1 Tax=Sorangium sp. So ce726 TaxID=3133319 RepID=UPI003F62A2F0